MTTLNPQPSLNYRPRRHPFFNLALVLSLWALSATVLLPIQRALAAEPDPTDPAVCPGFTLPPASPELDLILGAQAAISAAVFPAGAADFLYCNEGVWLLDEELDATKEIQSEDDNPIAGVTYGGDDFLVYPFLVMDLDLEELDLTSAELQWAQGENVQLSLVVGVIETGLGQIGFYGWYTGADDAADERIRMLVPIETSNAFDFLHLEYFGEGFNAQKYTGPLGDCVQAARNTYSMVDLPGCKIDFAVCAGLAAIAYAAAMIICGLSAGGVITIPIGAGCSLVATVSYLAALAGCMLVFYGCMLRAENKLRAAIANCLLQFP